MGYTHYWYQKRPFTTDEWEKILAEAKRIIAKARHGLYAGAETPDSNAEVNIVGAIPELGVQFRGGFKESYAWRTFPHPEIPTPMQGKTINVGNWEGKPGSKPILNNDEITFNGIEPEDYETFCLERSPKPSHWESAEEIRVKGIFSCCKTEYRPYDAIIVSILAVARTIAPDAIEPSSDGGDEAIKLIF